MKGLQRQDRNHQFTAGEYELGVLYGLSHHAVSTPEG